jgi:hypothetical protein
VEVPLQSHLSPQQLDIENPLRKDLGDKVRFLGYNIESGFRPGDNIHLTLFWQALQDMDTSYTVFCHLIGPDGRVWGQKDMPPAAGFHPTDSWVDKEIVRDQRDILTDPSGPTGMYTFHIGMYFPQTGERLPVIAADGDPEGDHIVLDGFRVDTK